MGRRSGFFLTRMREQMPKEDMRQEEDKMAVDLAKSRSIVADDEQPDEDELSLLDILRLHPLRHSLFAAMALALIVGAGVRYQNVGEVALVAVYIAVFVTCAATDLAVYRVLNVITYPSILLALLAAAFMPGSDFGAAIVGGSIALGFMLFFVVISRGAMGLGDVKLALFAGFALGFPFIEYMLMLMALSGGVAAVLLLLFRLKSRKDPIPYAPFISAASIAVMLWQGTAFHSFN